MNDDMIISLTASDKGSYFQDWSEDSDVRSSMNPSLEAGGKLNGKIESQNSGTYSALSGPISLRK